MKVRCKGREVKSFANCENFGNGAHSLFRNVAEQLADKSEKLSSELTLDLFVRKSTIFAETSNLSISLK